MIVRKMFKQSGSVVRNRLLFDDEKCHQCDLFKRRATSVSLLEPAAISN